MIKLSLEAGELWINADCVQAVCKSSTNSVYVLMIDGTKFQVNKSVDEILAEISVQKELK